jgi:hypothetical protein
MEYNRLVTGDECTLFKLFSKNNVVLKIIQIFKGIIVGGTKTNIKDLVKLISLEASRIIAANQFQFRSYLWV